MFSKLLWQWWTTQHSPKSQKKLIGALEELPSANQHCKVRPNSTGNYVRVQSQTQGSNYKQLKLSLKIPWNSSQNTMLPLTESKITSSSGKYQIKYFACMVWVMQLNPMHKLWEEMQSPYQLQAPISHRTVTLEPCSSFFNCYFSSVFFSFSQMHEFNPHE